MLKSQFLRDGRNQIVGSETRLENRDVVTRDREGRILGRTCRTFHNARDANGKLVSLNSDDAGLLFRK